MKQKPRYFILCILWSTHWQWQGSTEKRIFDLRTRQGRRGERKTEEWSKRRYEGDGREEGLYIETAEDEGKRGGWESVLNTCFSYRVHFEAWSAIPSLWHHHPGFCSSQKHRQHREYTHTHTHNPWFISLLNNSLLFSRPPLLGPQLPFDLSTPPPATSIHFYLRADALYPVLPFFFFFIPFVLLFFGPHPLGIIIDWRDTCSYLLGSSQRKNSSFDESISIVSFFFFYFSCSIVDREIAYRWENLRIIFISEYYYVSQLGYFLEALEKF